jgi:hypothetical protein
VPRLEHPHPHAHELKGVFCQLLLALGETLHSIVLSQMSARQLRASSFSWQRSQRTGGQGSPLKFTFTVGGRSPHSRHSVAITPAADAVDDLAGATPRLFLLIGTIAFLRERFVDDRLLRCFEGTPDFGVPLEGLVGIERGPEQGDEQHGDDHLAAHSDPNGRLPPVVTNPSGNTHITRKRVCV